LGGFSNKHVLAACREIGKGLHHNYHPYPVVEISSTVMPGSTMGPIRATLENCSNRVAGQDFGLAYSPEFIRQGQIIHDYAHPDMMLIGATNTRTASVLVDYYQSVTENDPPFHVMSPVSAETAKLGLNYAVVAKMAVANTLAALCHATPGADARDVLDVIGADSRIGPKFFSAGTWPGGPCFPRDVRALTWALVDAQVPTVAAAGVDVQRMAMASWLASIVGRMAGTTKTVG
ncbi:MAG: hypothetical protein GWN58_56875, partial [Anaerolineae bacterium]|nr:hypothetical protein [Anaerolineae bacterium]